MSGGEDLLGGVGTVATVLFSGVRDIDDVIVKGRTEPVGLYEVLDYHSEETFPNLMDNVSFFNDGRKHHRAGHWDKTIASFRECLKATPGDALSSTYIKRCRRLKKNPGLKIGGASG